MLVIRIEFLTVLIMFEKQFSLALWKAKSIQLWLF